MHKARIGALIKSNSSGSDYLDNIAIVFTNKCTRAVNHSGARSNRILNYLEDDVINIEPVYYLAIRAMNKTLANGLKKSDLAEFFFDSLNPYYGWKNKTQVRLDYLKDFITSMYDLKMLVRDGHDYFIR